MGKKRISLRVGPPTYETPLEQSRGMRVRKLEALDYPGMTIHDTQCKQGEIWGERKRTVNWAGVDYPTIAQAVAAYEAQHA